MAVAKIIEVVSEGDTLDDAIQNVVKEASKSIRNIRGIDIRNFHVIVEGDQIKKFRVDAKVSFVIEH